jgi:hypothetical protein
MVAVGQLEQAFGEAAEPRLRLVPIEARQAPAPLGRPALKADLALIEAKLWRRIALPDRPLTLEEEALESRSSNPGWLFWSHLGIRRRMLRGGAA